MEITWVVKDDERSSAGIGKSLKESVRNYIEDGGNAEKAVAHRIEHSSGSRIENRLGCIFAQWSQDGCSVPPHFKVIEKFTLTEMIDCFRRK